MTETKLHPVDLELFPAVPNTVDLASVVKLRARLRCPNGCNLKGVPVRILDAEGNEILTPPLTVFRNGANETDEFALSTPAEEGEWTVTVAFDGHDGEHIQRVISGGDIFDRRCGGVAGAGEPLGQGPLDVMVE